MFKPLALVASLLAVLSTAFLLTAPESGSPSAASRTVPAESGATPQASAENAFLVRSPDEVQEELPALPRDSRVSDIDVDGRVRTDMNGNLVLDRELRRFLDFYIGLAGHRNQRDALSRRVAAELELLGLSGEIQQQVLVILGDYLGYRQAAEALATAQHESLDDVRQVLGQLQDLRREYLGSDVADGFFGEEEKRLQVILDRQAILADESLTEDERENALAQLDQLLPEHSAQLRQRSRAVVETSLKVQALREQGAPEAEVRALRMEAYGAEATQRLSQLDEQRRQWQARLSHYQQEKEQILSNSGLATEDRQAAVEELQQRIFKDDAERRRIRALDRAPHQGS